MPAFSLNIYVGTLSGNGNHYDGTYNNWMFFGTQKAASVTYGGILKPEEMWNIDTKIDDGLGTQGKLVSGKSPLNPACMTGDTMTDTYNLTNSNPVCSIQFPQYILSEAMPRCVMLSHGTQTHARVYWPYEIPLP